jgi:serine protease AprX
MRKRVLITATLLLSIYLIQIPALIPYSSPKAEALSQIKLSTKLTRSLQLLGSTDPVSVIVLTYNPPSLLLKTLIVQLGGTIDREFQLLNGLAATLPVGSILQLSLNLEVSSISLNRLILPLMDVSRVAVGADTAQNSFGLDGKGIGVAIIDSGIDDSHEDLKTKNTLLNNGQKRVVYSENFVVGESTTRDLYGHGTHVAGIVAGDGYASSGSNSYRTIKGIAPVANLINLRVLNSNGSGAESDVIAAVERAVKLKTTYNIKIINLSLGAPVSDSYTKDPLCKVVDIAWQNGMVVVVSAGNFGNTQYGPYGLITSPGNSPSVITVGATNTQGTAELSDDTITTYSSRGPTLFDHVVKPDLVAPGNRVKSLIADSSTLDLDPQFASNHVSPSYYLTSSTGQKVRYFTLSGTSMASPVVAGAAALILQKDPSLNNHSVKLRLMASASKIFAQRYDLFTVGTGLLDIPAALASTGTATSSRSPYAVRTDDGEVQIIVDAGWDLQQEWSMGVVWGGNIIMSNGVVWGGSVVWGNGVVWGGSSPFNDPSANLFNPTAQRDISANGDE